MRMVAENAHRAGIPVGICGEAASDERMTYIWLGLGIDELSMVPSQASHIKYIVKHISQKEAEKTVQKVFEMDAADEVEQYLKERMADYEEIL